MVRSDCPRRCHCGDLSRWLASNNDKRTKTRCDRSGSAPSRYHSHRSGNTEDPRSGCRTAEDRLPSPNASALTPRGYPTPVEATCGTFWRALPCSYFHSNAASLSAPDVPVHLTYSLTASSTSAQKSHGNAIQPAWLLQISPGHELIANGRTPAGTVSTNQCARSLGTRTSMNRCLSSGDKPPVKSTDT